MDSSNDVTDSDEKTKSGLSIIKLLPSFSFSKAIKMKHTQIQPDGRRIEVTKDVIDPFNESVTIKSALQYIEESHEYEERRHQQLALEKERIDQELEMLRLEQFRWEALLRNEQLRRTFNAASEADAESSSRLTSMKDAIHRSTKESKEIDNLLKAETAKHHLTVSNKLQNEIDIRQASADLKDIHEQGNVLRGYLESEKFSNLAHLVEEIEKSEGKKKDLVNYITLKKMSEIEDEMKKESIAKELKLLFQQEEQVLKHYTDRENEIRAAIREFDEIAKNESSK
ncbi:hypothetical protein HK098_002041 [Nowakowskiella sp. JEL0407]|nr:hypothetical protein HK098_002041 [Nowakowskiella sp. JEL0407]